MNLPETKKKSEEKEDEEDVNNQPTKRLLLEPKGNSFITEHSVSSISQDFEQNAYAASENDLPNKNTGQKIVFA
jgi:hypothetical protein